MNMASEFCIMSTPRKQLLDAAQRLCNDFASQKSANDLQSHFSSTPETETIEYGEQIFAPFLGRKFLGPKGVHDYFAMLAQFITYHNMQFSDYIIDTDEMKVVVKGQARFTWISTEETWDETFHYALSFNNDYKVTKYEIWADSGAAYLAREGRLEYVRRHEGESPRTL